MGTKRTAGTQSTPKGYTQGNILVDPNTGKPISVITDMGGVRRLAVDANVTVGDITVESRYLAASTDSIQISDPNTGADLKINVDGSIDANIVANSIGDSIAIGDAITGDKLKVHSDGSADTRVVNTLITTPFDYIAATYPSSTVEVYTYKQGGVSGSIVGVVTVSYSDSTKNTITSVAKS